jgi:hypothetical protein
VKAKVVVRQWLIANQQAEEIPHQGFLVINLCAGKLVAVIEGDEPREWREGSFWSVPAGKSLLVRTARDSAVLQTVDFIEQSQ